MADPFDDEAEAYVRQVAQALGTTPEQVPADAAAPTQPGLFPAAPAAPPSPAGVTPEGIAAELEARQAEGATPGTPRFTAAQREAGRRYVEARARRPAGLPGHLVTELGVAHPVFSSSGGARPPGAVGELSIQPGPVGLDTLAVATHEQQQAAREAAEIERREQAMAAVIAERQALREGVAARHYAQIAQRHIENSQREVGQLAELLDAMQTRRIDPQRMWSNLGSASRFGVALSLAGGYAAHVLTGVATGVQEMVMQAIENDLQAQLSDSQNLQAVAQGRGNLVQTMRDLYQDETSALQAGRTIMLEEAKARLSALAASAQSARSQATLRDTIAGLEAARVLTINELLLNRIQYGLRGDPELTSTLFEAAVHGQANDIEAAQLRAAQAIHAASLPSVDPSAPPDIEGGQLPPDLDFPAAPAAPSAQAVTAPTDGATPPARTGRPGGGRGRVSRPGGALGPFPAELFDPESRHFNPPEIPPGYELVTEGEAENQQVRLVPRDRMGRPDVRLVGGGDPVSTTEERQLASMRAPPLSTLPEGSSIEPGAEAIYRTWSTSEQGRAFLGAIAAWPEIEVDFQILLNYYADRGWLGTGVRRPVTRSVSEARAHGAAVSLSGILQRILRSGPSDAIADGEAERLETLTGGTQFDLEDSHAVLLDTIRRSRGSVRRIALTQGGLRLNMSRFLPLPDDVSLSSEEVAAPRPATRESGNVD